ncbi:SDR family oxidoreductase [Paraburkholderia sp.]|uniref:SDR family oxidoreductase n=1 Tax=Paraburkholderia sp. TaxID=1926495 RepID=UPI0039E2A250
MSQLEKVAIVTGGGRGIGAAISRGLARDGYAVVVNYSSDGASAERVVHDIQLAGGRALAMQANVAKEEEVLRLFETVDQAFGAPAVLVNNGGVTGGFSRVEAISAQALQDVFAVNVIGAFLCSREAVKRMSTKRGGHGGVIVNLSSRAAQLGGSGEWVHYAATKGAIDTLTMGLAREVALEGIRVNAIAAGLIETDLHAAAGDPDRTARLAATVPMGRAGTAHEIAESVRWLVSPSAAYVTAAIVAVSGGR